MTQVPRLLADLSLDTVALTIDPSQQPLSMESEQAPDPRNMETMSLIEQHRAGQSEALEELFRRYAERVRRIVRIRMGNFLRSRADVEDVVQETMLRAFESIDRYEVREDARLIDWMARIAENSLRNLFQHERAQKRDPKREVAIENLRDKAQHSSLGWDLVSPTSAPPEKLSTKEMEGIVDECLAGLPEDQRESILLVDYADGDWEFVAQKTQRPSPEAAKKFHTRARISLAAMVERRLQK